MSWPRRGVYFFFEESELRSAEPRTQRVVRVGTHALKMGGTTTLWQRLSNHKGTLNGGNHRGSIFRLLVGDAMINKDGLSSSYPCWGKGKCAGSHEVTILEQPMEKKVSSYLSAMKILWLEVPDAPGPKNNRSYIERNCIALLSNIRNPIDQPSENWLGRFSTRAEVRASGLWNQDYTQETYDPTFIQVLEKYVNLTANNFAGEVHSLQTFHLPR